MKLWEAKLGSLPPELVEAALLAYNGPFFPDPGLIVTMVAERRASAYQERGNRDWEQWKADQAEAEREGKLATEADYERMREGLRKLAAEPVSGESLERHRKGFAAAGEAAQNATANGSRIPAHDIVGVEKSASD